MPNKLYFLKSTLRGCFFHALTDTYPKYYPLFFANPTRKMKNWRITDLQKVGVYMLY